MGVILRGRMIDLKAGLQAFANRLYAPQVVDNAPLNLALQAAMTDVCRLVPRCRLVSEGPPTGFWGSWSLTDVRRFCELPSPLPPELHRAVFENGIGNPPDRGLELPIEEGECQVTLRAQWKQYCVGAPALELGCQMAITTGLNVDDQQTTKLWLRRLLVAPCDEGPQPASEDLDIGLSTCCGREHEPIWRQDARLEANNYYDGDSPDDRCAMRLCRVDTSWYERGWSEAQGCLARYDGSTMNQPRWEQAYRRTHELLPRFLAPFDPYWAPFEGLDPVTAA